MTSSRRDGETVVVTTGNQTGHRYIVLEESAIEFEERGRRPTEQEQAEAGRFAPMMPPVEPPWGRRRRRYG